MYEKLKARRSTSHRIVMWLFQLQKRAEQERVIKGAQKMVDTYRCSRMAWGHNVDNNLPQRQLQNKMLRDGVSQQDLLLRVVHTCIHVHVRKYTHA